MSLVVSPYFLQLLHNSCRNWEALVQGASLPALLPLLFRAVWLAGVELPVTFQEWEADLGQGENGLPSFSAFPVASLQRSAEWLPSHMCICGNQPLASGHCCFSVHTANMFSMLAARSI